MGTVISIMDVIEAHKEAERTGKTPWEVMIEQIYGVPFEYLLMNPKCRPDA